MQKLFIRDDDAGIGVTWLITFGGEGRGNGLCLYCAFRKTQVFHFFCLYATQIID
jgi:hypothetical protein